MKKVDMMDLTELDALETDTNERQVKTQVSLPPIYGIFSYKTKEYFGFWVDRELAEEELNAKYDDNFWYVDEMVQQDE